jgi:ricin-type beta-trefoil lectin protein
MQRTGRTAAAATFSALLVAGTVTGFMLTGGTAQAGAATDCTLDATATTCDIGTTSAPHLITGYPVDIWLQAASSDPAADGGDTITLTYGDTCEDPTTSIGEPNTTSTVNLTTANTLSSDYSFPIGLNDAVQCSVWVTATATSTLGSGDVITVNLYDNLGTAPTSTATATASATPSPTPTATASKPAPVTVHQVHGFDGTCVDDFGNSSAERTKIGIWTCSPKDTAQSWTYSGDELHIHGMCINAKGSGKSGSKLILWKCTGAGNEVFVHNSKQEYVEKAGGWRYCVDDPAYSTKNGTQLFVYTCNNGPNQHWSLP